MSRRAPGSASAGCPAYMQNGVALFTRVRLVGLGTLRTFCGGSMRTFCGGSLRIKHAIDAAKKDIRRYWSEAL